MKKYVLALRHFIPHLIAVAAVSVVALFFPLRVLEAILITAFSTLLLPYMEKVKEVERRLKVDRKVQRKVDFSGNTTTGPATKGRDQPQQGMSAKLSEPVPIRAAQSEIGAQENRLSFVNPPLKALAFFLGGLTVVGVVGYALIYLLLYFFFYP
jgi:hypothetical protein